MENILNIALYFKKILFLFPCEIFCITGVILNFFVWLLPVKRLKIKKVSNFFTILILVLNSCALLYLYFKGFNETTTIIKFLLNLFMLFFVLTTYKITSKFRYRVVSLNCIVLNILLFGFLITTLKNCILIYILFELIVYSVYRYSLLAKLRKKQTNSSAFVLISSCATVLFCIFFFLCFYVKDLTQLNIIHACAACALLLKIGIFPFYNYSLDFKIKNNIPYSILLFCYVLQTGLLSFSKIIQSFYFNSAVFKSTILYILIFAAFSFGFSTLKQKNLVKFMSQACYFYASFITSYLILCPKDNVSISLIFLYSFCALGIFALLSIIKLNSQKQINTNLIKGLYYSNKPISYLLSAALLIYTSIIPSSIVLYNIKALRSIYLFSVQGTFLCFVFIILNVFVFLNVVKIIQSIYCVNLKKRIAFKKAAILNYITAFVILIFLIISYFL